MQDRSETLFYHLIIENVIDMMPLICMPSPLRAQSSINACWGTFMI